MEFISRTRTSHSCNFFFFFWSKHAPAVFFKELSPGAVRSVWRGRLWHSASSHLAIICPPAQIPLSDPFFFFSCFADAVIGPSVQLLLAPMCFQTLALGRTSTWKCSTNVSLTVCILIYFNFCL